MDDSAEELRRRMAETATRISQRFASLDDRVSEMIGSTSEAVSEAAIAVKSVATSVHGAVESVTHACDVRRGFEKRPWTALGGSALAGFIAGELVSTALRQVTRSTTCETPSPRRPEPSAGFNGAASGVASTGTAPRNEPSGSAWRRVEVAAIAALMSAAQLVASRAAPQIIDRILSTDRHVPSTTSKTGVEP